jgi:hypothetical protein
MGMWIWVENITPLWGWIVWGIAVGAIVAICIWKWLKNRNRGE